MRDIVAVSQKSWKHDAGIAISSNDEALRFFTAFTQAGSRAGWLWVWILTVEDVPVAMEYDLLHDGTVSALRADFDESYSSSSPGAYLESHIVQQVFESGYREYSSGPGLNAYKLHWTERMRENVVVRVFNGTLRGCALWQLEHRLLPLARRLRRVPKHETPARLGKER
jgi:CelD/BcsL family acetyltransferase involved in cellulose biosynthesis